MLIRDTAIDTAPLPLPGTLETNILPTRRLAMTRPFQADRQRGSAWLYRKVSFGM